MPNFGNMISRTSREIRRDGLTADIKASIDSTIRFYSSERFWFNEGEATSQLTTGITSISYPTNFRDVDTVEISSTATDRIELQLRTIEEVRQHNSSPDYTGVPWGYATFKERIFTTPRPDGIYEIKVFGHLDLTGVSASAANGATNAWMDEGEALIRSGAKADLARHRLRNYPLADQMDIEAEREKRRLFDTTVDKISTGKVVKTRF